MSFSLNEYLNKQNDINRYIPDLRTNNMITNLNLSRIEPTRASVIDQSYNRFPTDESPFNPVIFENVKYSTNPYITKTNRVVSKYENNNPGNNNIALYDTHKYTLNCLNEPYMANNQMYNNLMKIARDKVRLKETDLLNSYGPRDSTNAYIYNPYLPESETNKNPNDYLNIKSDYQESGYSALNLDPRLNQHTNERAWNYASTRSDIAYDLQRANFIKERNHRQHEADDALLHRTRKDRWVEPKMAYMQRKQNPHYSLSAIPTPNNGHISGNNNNITDSTLEPSYRKQNDLNRIALEDYDRKIASEQKVTESFVRARNDLHKTPPIDSHSYNVRAAEIYRNYEPVYQKHMDEVYIKDIPNMRKENYSAPESIESPAAKAHVPETPKTPLEKLKAFFDWNHTGDRDGLQPGAKALRGELTHDSAKNRTGFENGKITYYNNPGYNQADYVKNDPNINQSIRNATNSKERFIYKPDHVLVIKQGTTDIYPDTELTETASSVITPDPYKPSIIRNMCLLVDGKFVLLQKLTADSIFTGDYKRVDDDLISVEIPIENLAQNFRKKIQKYNTSTNRDKVLNLTYDDFIEIIKYIEKHPNMQKRLDKNHLHARVRMSDYDKELVNNFGSDEVLEGQKIFVDNKVYNGIAAGYRHKLEQHQRGRADKDLYSISNTTNGEIVLKPTGLQSNNNQSRTHMGLNTNRTEGFRRGKFD